MILILCIKDLWWIVVPLEIISHLLIFTYLFLDTNIFLLKSFEIVCKNI